MKPLTDDERQLAEAAARCIATAEEIGLPDSPEKIVTSPHAIRFLARAHLDLLARVARIHAVVGDLEQLVGLRRALADQLRSIQAHVDEIAKTAIDAALREQDEGLKKKWSALLATFSSASGFVDTVPGARRRAFPKLVADKKASAETESGAPVDLLALYCRVMREPEASFVKHASYIVRVWDGMDGCWTDCTGEVDRDEALRVWAERTGGGTRQVSFAEIDYYRIFPGGTRMDWDGSEGREMFR
ncbi:MAG TPA: hypothetical protein VLE97_06480 [Gaiellaceae bacterium]|nr:hypothetical protein [Gaiellaceae bacterium]